MNRLLLLTLAMVTSLTLQAQVKEASLSMSRGANNALTITLPKTTEKEVRDAWENYIRKLDGKTKTDKKSGEMFTDNAELKEINGNNTLDIYAKPTVVGDGVQFAVWFDLGGAFLSSKTHADRYPAAEKFVYAFAVSVSKALIEEQLAAEVKKGKALEEELKELVKDKAKAEANIKDYEKEIESLKGKIEKTKQEISTNTGDQNTVKQKIETQKTVIQKVQQQLNGVK